MAITAETRQDIIELVVTAYGAAPGTTLLTELVAIVDDGGTLVGAADTVGDAAGGSMVDTGVSTRTDSEAESLHAPTMITSTARATRRHVTR